MAFEKLEKHELFGLLGPEEIRTLSSASGVAALKEGDKVYSEGVPASHLFVLLKGRVELRRRTREGQSFVVDDLMEGSIFGVSALMEADRYLLDAECVMDSEVLKIEVKTLRRVLDQNPIQTHRSKTKCCDCTFLRTDSCS